MHTRAHAQILFWFESFPHTQCPSLWDQLEYQHSEVIFWNVRRWADKFCLHCNTFIYIRHIWIKPVLYSRMVSLFHRATPWTHRCLQSSPSAHRNGRVSDVRFKQRAVIEFLTMEKGPPIEIHRWMQAIYDDQCVDVSTVRRWVGRLKKWSLQWGNGFKNKMPIFLRTHFKN